METNTTIRSLPAIAGGAVSASIAWATIIRDHGYTNITLDHVQAGALVGLTVLAGHLAGQSWHQRKRLASFGLVMLSIVGTLLTIYNGMGSRAETRDVKVAAAQLSDGERARITSDLDHTTKLVATAEGWVQNECKSGRGPKCAGATFVLQQRQASKAALAAQLQAVGPVAVAEPKAAQVALLASLAGYNAGTVKAVVSALEPLAFPLFLELLAIVLFSYGLGHKTNSASVIGIPVTDTQQTSFDARVVADNDPVDPTPRGKRGRKRDSNVVDFVQQFRASNGRNPNIPEMRAAFPELDKSTLWRNAKAA